MTMVKVSILLNILMTFITKCNSTNPDLDDQCVFCKGLVLESEQVGENKDSTPDTTTPVQEQQVQEDSTLKGDTVINIESPSGDDAGRDEVDSKISNESSK